MDGTKIELPTPISTSGPPADVPLLRKAVEWAEAEAAKPEAESEWYQGAFAISGENLQRSCGTAYCIAGWVLHEAGIDARDEPDAVGLAADLLGLTRGDYVSPTSETHLFWDENAITDIRRIAERIAARAGERL